MAEDPMSVPGARTAAGQWAMKGREPKHLKGLFHLATACISCTGVLTTWTISAFRSFSRRRFRFSARRSFFS